MGGASTFGASKHYIVAALNPPVRKQGCLNGDEPGWVQLNGSGTVTSVVTFVLGYTLELVRGLILAAGMGRRLGARKPKCLTLLAGRPLIDYQLESFRNAGVTEIGIVTGFQAQMLTDRAFAAYFHNVHFATTNMLHSLYVARDWFEEDVIISYSDIVLSPKVVSDFSVSTDPVSVATDPEWWDTYIDRSDHPVQEAELVIETRNNQVLKIGKGKSPTNQEEVATEFIGLFKVSSEAWAVLDAAYAALRDQALSRDKSGLWFNSLYVTDLLQKAIELGMNVGSHSIAGPWREIDTPQDLESAEKWIRSPSIRTAFEGRP